MKCDCRCKGLATGDDLKGDCRYLYIYPEMPALDPPPLTEIWTNPGAEWTLFCNWMGPLIDGKATLLRKGLKTDGTSIPRWAWRAFGHPFSLPVLAYALPHDGDYSAELVPRDEGDDRFLEGMAQDKHVCWVKRNGIWTAVRAGGGFVWNRHTPESISEARKYCRIVGAEEYAVLCESRRLDITPDA